MQAYPRKHYLILRMSVLVALLARYCQCLVEIRSAVNFLKEIHSEYYFQYITFTCYSQNGLICGRVLVVLFIFYIFRIETA